MAAQPSERGNNNTRLRGRGSGNDGSGAIKRVRLVGNPLGCLELLLVLVLVLADGSVLRLPPAALKRSQSLPLPTHVRLNLSFLSRSSPRSWSRYHQNCRWLAVKLSHKFSIYLLNVVCCPVITSAFVAASACPHLSSHSHSRSSKLTAPSLTRSLLSTFAAFIAADSRGSQKSKRRAKQHKKGSSKSGRQETRVRPGGMNTGYADNRRSV
ncbi:hypothetical protein ACLKA6_004426 [Drosophila palustris]